MHRGGKRAAVVWPTSDRALSCSWGPRTMQGPTHLGDAMRCLRAAGAVLALGLITVFAPGAPASAATIPDASVHIHLQAFEGPRGTILASYKIRCAPGFEPADVEINFSQGSVTTPPIVEQPNIDCNGTWYERKVKSLEAFEPGPATMSVRFSVTDVQFGDPGEDGFDQQTIFVRPAALAVIPATAELRPNHVVKIIIKARCDKPWVLQDFSITATQDEFPNIKSDDETSQTYPVCDGVLHSRTFFFKSSSGNFHKGKLRIDTSISLLDPENFDPVTQANQTRIVTVQ